MFRVPLILKTRGYAIENHLKLLQAKREKAALNMESNVNPAVIVLENML